MRRREFLTSAVFGGPLAAAYGRDDEAPLRIAAFQADVTPPLGSPLCVGLVAPAKRIVDPLGARGIVLWGQQAPLVLCAVDCVLIANAAYVLHMPGELFAEYQLAAQKMRPDAFVCMAAYGDHGPSDIGTKLLYEQGGCESTRSCTAPEVEDVLMSAMAELLEVWIVPKKLQRRREARLFEKAGLLKPGCCGFIRTSHNVGG